MNIIQLLLSPAFERDHVAFARLQTGEAWHSTDGGDSWERIDTVTRTLAIALSPAFEQDQTLLRLDSTGGDCASGSVTGDRLCRSLDAGTNWRIAGTLPPGTYGRMLSLAPDGLGNGLAFAFGGNCSESGQGVLYRSNDGGQSWTVVLRIPAQYWLSLQLRMVYTPGFRQTGEAFALFTWEAGFDEAAGEPIMGGTIYHSTDRGLTWQVMPMPGDVSPTAVALSPDFANDGQLLVGTADGRVLLVAR